MDEGRNFNEVFAKRLRHYLDEYEMTQIDFANRIGVGSTTVYNWLHGLKSPRMDKVDVMCEMFNCRRADLMEDDVPVGVTLSEDERILLDNYRMLDPYSRGRVDQLIDSMLEKKTERMEGDVNVG